jgi:hypothetical protein
MPGLAHRPKRTRPTASEGEIGAVHAVGMDGRSDRSGADRWRWDLVVARLTDEVDKLNDYALDGDSRSEAVREIFEIFYSIMSRAQELETFAELWTEHHPVLQERLDEIRLAFPLPVPSWDGVGPRSDDDV